MVLKLLPQSGIMSNIEFRMYNIYMIWNATYVKILYLESIMVALYDLKVIDY